MPFESMAQPEVQEEAIVEKKETTRETRKKSTPLPAEFRKSLRVAEHQDKKIDQADRDERLPSLNILLADQAARPDERTINQTAGMIEKTLAEFGISATVIGFRVGPTVTQFAVQPGFIPILVHGRKIFLHQRDDRLRSCIKKQLKNSSPVIFKNPIPRIECRNDFSIFFHNLLELR